MADRARCILLIFWHATLSPCPAFISPRRLYPPLRYSLSPPLPRRKLSSAILPRRARARDRRTFSSFNSLARSLSSPPLCRPFLSVSFLSFSCIHIAHTQPSLDALRRRPLSSFFASLVPYSALLARVLLARAGIFSRDPLLLSGSLSRLPSVRRAD